MEFTNEMEAFFGRTCAVRSSAGNVMARQIGAASSFNRQSIEQRPAIVSLVERKTGYTLICKVKRNSAEPVTKATTRLLRPHRSRVHTITSDNGREFIRHEEIGKQLNADCCFIYPYPSWE